MIIKVKTPEGKEVIHGKIERNVFIRHVTTKDKMRIFNSHTIHPEVLGRLFDKYKVTALEYYETDTGKIYSMDTDTARKVGFEKTFAGGRTVYLQDKHWTAVEQTKVNSLNEI